MPTKRGFCLPHRTESVKNHGTSQPAPTDAVVHRVLLALAAEELHGYALMKAVEEQSGGVLTSGTGTRDAIVRRAREVNLGPDSELATERRG